MDFIQTLATEVPRVVPFPVTAQLLKGCSNIWACSSVGLEYSSDKGVVPGSSPGRPTMSGDVAQMGERLPCTEEVRGSNPLISTEALDRRRRLRYTGSTNLGEDLV
jgi:hypothetical protein